MNIYGRLYRFLMKLSHRVNWHYAPVIGPFDDGRKQRWCKWCGMRDWVIDYEALRRKINESQGTEEK
jgi:hypothetical protein